MSYGVSFVSSNFDTCSLHCIGYCYTAHVWQTVSTLKLQQQHIHKQTQHSVIYSCIQSVIIHFSYLMAFFMMFFIWLPRLSSHFPWFTTGKAPVTFYANVLVRSRTLQHICVLAQQELDCFTALPWWQWDYQQRMTPFGTRWFGYSLGLPQLQSIVGSRDWWGFPPFIKATDSPLIQT